MCGYDRYTWPEAKYIQVNRQYLGDMSFFQMAALRGGLPKLSQPFPKPKHEVRRFGGRVEKLRASAFMFIG